MELIEVNGGMKGGSGTILRLAVALSAVRQEPLHIFNIRRNRPEKGLKPQHLEAVLTAARLCDAEVKGASIGSQELWFTPNKIHGGHVKAEIGTAGSISMVLMTVFPICILAREDVTLDVVRGGTDVPFSPTINYWRSVFLPTLKKMGIETETTVRRYGYYPKGNGEVTTTIQHSRALKPLKLESFGNVRQIQGVSVATSLKNRRVAERQAEAAKNILKRAGYSSYISIINDTSNPIQKGSSITLWVETDAGAILGSDAIGELKKPSETVGQEAAGKLLEELSSKPTVDAHLADLLIPYMALAEGTSNYLTRTITEHLDSNIWLVKKILETNFEITMSGRLFKVEKC